LAAAKAVGEITAPAATASGVEERQPIDAQLRQLATDPETKVSSADDRLADYETLLIARFWDILQGLCTAATSDKWYAYVHYNETASSHSLVVTATR
jgi:hypothetical protein